MPLGRTRKFHLRLTDDERQFCRQVTQERWRPSLHRRNAELLLAADEVVHTERTLADLGDEFALASSSVLRLIRMALSEGVVATVTEPSREPPRQPLEEWQEELLALHATGSFAEKELMRRFDVTRGELQTLIRNDRAV